MDLDDVEAIDVRPLGGTDAVTINDVTGTDLERVDIDLGAALGGSAGDGLADTVTVIGTAGDDTVAATASGAAVDVSGLAAFVQITNADPASDALVIDTLAGADVVALDPALAALIPHGPVSRRTNRWEPSAPAELAWPSKTIRLV
jgi:hypothetical protein